MSREHEKKEKSLKREAAEVLLYSTLIAWFLLTFVVQPARVSGISMHDTLQVGQRLVFDKISYIWEPYTKGDLVIVEKIDDTVIIKRVIAEPGDIVSLEAGLLTVISDDLPAPLHIDLQNNETRSPIQLEEGYIYVLGDNVTSTNHGLFTVENVIGRPTFSYYPLDTFGPVDDTHAYPSSPRTINQAQEDERKSNTELVPLPTIR